MSIPRWHAQLQHLLDRHAHLPHARFVSAANVRTDGRPANRTLTFRGFLDAQQLIFTSDLRAEKVAQLASHPWMELCWYFTETRIQMRLLGRMQVVAAAESPAHAEVRMGMWRERTEQSRQSFTWPAPGQPAASREAFEQPCPQLPPANFALLLFQPEQVDTLDLAPHPHRRVLHKLESGIWKETTVNP